MVMETDREAIDLALRGAGCRDAARARVVRIGDTLHLDDVLVSDAVLDEVRGKPNVEVMGGRSEDCDVAGTLRPC